MYQATIKSRKTKTVVSDLIYPGEDQEIALVQTMLGNCRMKVLCKDGTSLVARVRGSMRSKRNKVLINSKDVILISKRDFDDTTCDILHKYSDDDVRDLTLQKLMPEAILKAMTATATDYNEEDDDEDLFGYDTKER